MTLRTIFAVFRAELASVVRDRRTIVTSVLVPVLLYPAGGLGLTAFASRGLAAVRAEAAKVCLLGAPDDTAAIAGVFAGGDDAPKIERADCAPGAAPDAAIDAVVDVPAGAAAALARGEGSDLAIRYDSTSFRGPRAKERFAEALAGQSKKLVATRLASANLPARFASPLRFTSTDVAPPQRSDLFVWAPAIIVFLVLFSILGVFLPAIDLTAGDRERLTLETLLTAPVSSAELIAGKFGVVCAMGFTTTILNISSLYGTLSLVTSAAPEMKIGAAMTPHTALLLIAASLPTVALSGAVCMAIGCLARSFRDAQNYLTPVYLGLLLPAYAAALPTAKLTTFSAAVPWVNTPLMLREIFAGTLRPLHALIVVVVDILFCGVALLVAGRLYGHEGIAFADAQPVDLLRRPASGSSRFTTGEAWAVFAVVTALVIYVGFPLQVHGGYTGVVLTELALILAPPLVWAWWRRIDGRTAFALRSPGWRGATAAILLGAGTWLPVNLYMAYLQQPVFPLPPGAEDAIRKALGIGQISAPALLLVGAFLPAVCEEVLFRGAVMQALLPSMRRNAIVITAILFGILHLDPWRFAPTFLLGLVAGLLVYSTGSIVAGMLFHFTNNAVAVALTASNGAAESAVPPWMLVVAAICIPVGTWILWGPRPAPHEDPA